MEDDDIEAEDAELPASMLEGGGMILYFHKKMKMEFQLGISLMKRSGP